MITGPLLRKIPVLSLTERALQMALHLLNKPTEPTFVGQVTATDPLAVPMLVLFSFPIFVNFAVLLGDRNSIHHRVALHCLVPLFG